LQHNIIKDKGAITIPYPTEHSARIREPEDFEQNSFRSKKIDTGIRVIIGKLKGETTTTAQSYRFHVDYFTVKKAKKWLKDHDIEYIKFEPAEEQKSALIKGNTMGLAYRTEKNAKAIASFWGKPLEKNDWYKIEAKSEEETEIIIYDVIGYPYNDAFDLVRALGEIKGKNITIRINSPGGDVFDGLAIYNALREHKARVTTKNEGIASSIASIIALAGDEVQAHKNAMYMIHDPWVLTAGNQYELRDIADILAKISVNMVDIYSDNSNIGKRELKEMMKEETWLTAKEAKDRGFVDTVLDTGVAKANFDLSMFANVPAGEPTIRKKEQALRDVGFSQKEAKALLSRRREGTQRDVEVIQAEVEKIKNIMTS